MQHQRFMALLIAAAGLLALLPAATLAEQRVALVIGNAGYAHAPRLANPLNDAADIGEALARLGFQVTKLENADYAALRQGLLAFTRAASAAEVAVVFYAGHGIEVDQRNFLVPVDARLVSDQDVEFETVPLELVTRSVARASGLRLVILDACRKNPFAVSMQRAGATRSVGRGLARVEPAGETLVAYAAKEGTVAADGGGRNSPYSAALLEHLEEPGLEVGLMFRKVRDAVLAATGGRQEPFVYGSLSSRGVYLAAQSTPELSSQGGPAADGQAVAPPRDRGLPSEAELLFWESVKDSREATDLQAYLDRYPGGVYEVLARNRLRRLAGSPEQTAAQGPPSPASPEFAEEGLGLSRSDRRLIQLGLKVEGFNPGLADGLFGRGTRTAIGRWQASQGQVSMGYLEAESAKLLLASGRQREARDQEATRQAAAEAERKKREQEARERAQREAEEKARYEAEERARQAAAEAAARRPIGPKWVVAKNQPCQLYNSYLEPGLTFTATWSGSCIDRKASGEGRVVWEYKDLNGVYKGWVRSGKLHGQGIMTYSDGRRYKGEYRDSKTTGRGIMTWANGTRYEGQWRNCCFGERGGRTAWVQTSAAACGFE